MKYKKIKAARKWQGISLIQMSKKLHMNFIKYWWYEQHIQHFDCKTFTSILDLLGVSYD